MTSLPEVICCRSWGEVVSTKGLDSAENSYLVRLNSEICSADPAAAEEMRANAVSKVKFSVDMVSAGHDLAWSCVFLLIKTFVPG